VTPVPENTPEPTEIPTPEPDKYRVTFYTPGGTTKVWNTPNDVSSDNHEVSFFPRTGKKIWLGGSYMVEDISPADEE
jgi:hypothetical protein